MAAPRSLAADGAMKKVPAGAYVAGSTAAEREAAYADHERTARAPRAREGRWFEREEERHEARLARDVWLDESPVTNAAYAEFVRATGHRAPAIDEAAWRAQGYVQDYATQVARYVWSADGTPPAGREEHPVLLVAVADAEAYCAWRGGRAGAPRRLPTAAELERAMRGDDGRVYPWGDAWDAARTNSMVGGPGDTEPVGARPAGAGPYGHLDLAGNVFAWTSTPWPFGPAGRQTIKGAAWDDYAGVGRGAARHGRPKTVKHTIVGFRCAGDAAPAPARR